MLINPYLGNLEPLPGSRILVDTCGVLGKRVVDPKDPSRPWYITGIYAPLQTRALGGVRVKLEDEKGFVTFCNQRDLELLLYMAKPGDLCPWTNKEYPRLDSREFYGLCCDDEDLRDDLLDREYAIRAQYPGVLPHGLELTRRVHLSHGRDVEELYLMFYDADPDTGYGPDPRLETVDYRWSRVERNKLNWRMAA